MVQVPKYRPGTGAPSPASVSLRPPPAVAPPNTGSISRGFGGLERGAAQLERGANRLRAGGESVARGAEAAANAADRLSDAQGDVARAALGVAATVGQFYERQAERDAKDLLTELIERRTNRETEYLAKNGQDAVDAYKPTIEGFDADYEEIAAKAKSGLSKRMLEEQWNLQRIEFGAKVGRHSLVEQEGADLDSSAALQEEYKRQAILNYDDTQLLEKNLVLIAQETASQGDILGWSDETVAFETIKAQSTVHKGVVARMLEAGNYDGAAEYLEQAMDSMLADDYIKSNAKLKSVVEALRKEGRKQVLKQQAQAVAEIGQEVSDVAKMLKEGMKADTAGLVSRIAGMNGLDEDLARKLTGFEEDLAGAEYIGRGVRAFNEMSYKDQDQFLLDLENRVRNWTGPSNKARLREHDLLVALKASRQETVAARKDGTLIDIMVLRDQLPMDGVRAMDIGEPGDLNPTAIANRRVARTMLEGDRFGYGKVPLVSKAKADDIARGILGEDGSDLDTGLSIAADLVFKFGKEDALSVMAQSMDKYSAAFVAGSIMVDGDHTTGRNILNGFRKLRDPATMNNVPKLTDADRKEEYNKLKKDLEVEGYSDGLVDPIIAASSACFATTTADKGDTKAYRSCIKDVTGGMMVRRFSRPNAA